jgi:hypothetical protein
MTFKEIYERIIPLWGDKIEFYDGLVSKPQNGINTPGTTPTDNDYFSSQLFQKQWDRIEEIVGHEDTFGDLMVWTMYQVFHRHARQLFRERVFELIPKDISKKEIEEQYFSNLNEESWEEDLAKYERDVD